MDDLARVCIGYGIAYLVENPQHGFEGISDVVGGVTLLQFLNDVLQAVAGHELHREKGQALFADAHIVNRHDIGVCQVGGQLGLPQELLKIIRGFCLEGVGRGHAAL